MDYVDGPKPRFFAHRGGALEAPENTIEAFTAGMTAGADRLELDVHATAGGEVVVLHDETVDRTTDGTGPVRSKTLAEVRELDAGAQFRAGDGTASFAGRGVRIPTLAEVFEAFPGVPLNIEIKQDEPQIEAEVLAVIDRFSARKQVLLAAEHGVIMERIRVAAPDVCSGTSLEDGAEFLDLWAKGRLGDYQPRGIAFQVPPTFLDQPLVTKEFVEVAHAASVEVHVWTIDEVDEIERLLGLGVDGIMTDRPTVCAKVFRRLGLR
ncbi:MAG: glycerophosphodiester phosphodiesterase [Candidatus Binatia bacterium]|nr:glycerophosphodiester phosphodiesterase [Candidatus Binatia bacterium]